MAAWSRARFRILCQI